MRTPKIVAALGAASVLAAGLFAPGADARVVSGNDSDIAADSVDASQPISLLVKKVATNPYDDVPAGEKPPAVEGATFKLSRVNNLDVTTDEGREKARGFSLDDAREAGTTEIASATTNSKGAAQFTNLKPGLYLLEEQAPDDGREYHVSSPRLIILPLADVTGERFTYENVVVTKWDGDTGDGPSTTPTPTPATETTTSGTTERTTEKTTVPTPVESTITTTRSDGSTTVITTRPSTYVTTQPNGSVTTVTQSQPRDRSRGGDLASTGANVLWAAGLGGLLILVGFVLARRSKNEETTR